MRPRVPLKTSGKGGSRRQYDSSFREGARAGMTVCADDSDRAGSKSERPGGKRRNAIGDKSSHDRRLRIRPAKSLKVWDASHDSVAELWT